MRMNSFGSKLSIGASGAMLAVLLATSAWAQATVPPPQVSAPAAATPAAAPKPASAQKPASASAAKGVASPRACTRLPLSDIQVGREKTIEVARLRLDEYIAKVGKQKGWKSWDKSLETISCEDYLFVPLLGQEYKCLVTATFCKKS